MRKGELLAALVAGCFIQPAEAQFVIAAPTAAASAVPPSPNWMSSVGRVYTDTTTIFGRRTGVSGPRISISCNANTDSSCDPNSTNFNPQSRQPNYTVIDPNGSGGGGAFRIGCGFSHVAYDDPIVFPGNPGMSHPHYFYGNTSTSSASVLTDMSLTGDSTCAGGTANATGYWIPALIYSCPTDSTDPCDHSRDGEFQASYSLNAYYKCPSSGIITADGDTSGQGGYRCSTGGYGGTPARWFPVGLRMITGDPASTTGIPSGDGGVVCYRGDAGIQSFDHIPTTAEAQAIGGCDNLNFFPQFRECWDGVNLDSPDHKSHMARANYYTGCPATHPVLVPWIGLNIHMPVRTEDLDHLRLSSDPPKSSGRPAGWTLHSDWVNGWSHTPNFGGFGKGTLGDLIMQGCYHITGPKLILGDCHDDNLGSPLGDGKYWWLEPNL